MPAYRLFSRVLWSEHTEHIYTHKAREIERAKRYISYEYLAIDLDHVLFTLVHVCLKYRWIMCTVINFISIFFSSASVILSLFFFISARIFFSLCRFYYLDIYWYNFSFSPFNFYVALFRIFFLAWMVKELEKWTKECTGVLTFLEWVCVCVSCLLLSFQRSSIIQSDQSIEINTKKLQNIP